MPLVRCVMAEIIHFVPQIRIYKDSRKCKNSNWEKYSSGTNNLSPHYTSPFIKIMGCKKAREENWTSYNMQLVTISRLFCNKMIVMGLIYDHMMIMWHTGLEACSCMLMRGILHNVLDYRRTLTHKPQLEKISIHSVLQATHLPAKTEPKQNWQSDTMTIL
jgi:hypothetical protein